jgi:hypothetical protein
LGLGFILALLAMEWHRAETRYHELVTPPKGRNTMQEFLRVRPDYLSIRSLSIVGKPYFEVLGRFPNEGLVDDFLLLPSGPPAYIFDNRGVLVDWRADMEDGRFSSRWGRYHPDVTAAEAIRAIETNSAKP